MHFILLVLAAIFSNLSKGTYSTEMDCTAVESVYNRIKDSVKTTPMYQILKDRDKSLCYRSKDHSFSSNYIVISETCCDRDREIGLALTSSTLFRQYLYTDSFQGYKYALHDIVLHYKSEIGKVLDPDLQDYFIECVQKKGTSKSLMKALMKEQLRIYLQRKELYNVPSISNDCFNVAERFIKTFTSYLDKYLKEMAGLIDGINIALKLLEALQNQKISPKCVEAVTRSSVMTVGCNQCQSASATFKTCRSLCSNVVNGCMKPLLTLIPSWHDWLKTMDSLDFNLTKERDSLLEIKIAQKLQDSFTVDYHSLDEACQIDKSNTNSITRIPRNYWKMPEDGGSVDSHPLFQDMFGPMFDDIQAKFCRGLDLSTQDDYYPCWNGTHVANYTRNLTYFNERSQDTNPEVEDNSFIHFTAQRAHSDLENFNLRFGAYRDETDLRIPVPSVTAVPKTEGYNMSPTTIPVSSNNRRLPCLPLISLLLVFSFISYSRHRWLLILAV